MSGRVITEQELRGSEAMAFDRVAAESVASGGPTTVRLYRWAPSCVTLGYRTDASTVDWEYCASNNIEVTRRPSGGGAIYHDNFADVSYSIIVPADQFPGDVSECYQQLLQPIITAFDTAGVNIDFAGESTDDLWQPLCYLLGLDPVHDLVGSDGRKIAGNAQYRTKDAIIQHGSLSFVADGERHLKPFSDSPVSTDQFDTHVCGVRDFIPDMSRSQFVTLLEDALAEWANATVGEWTRSECDRMRAVVDDKYNSDAWICNRNDPL